MTYTTFHGHLRIAAGDMAANADAVRAALPVATAPVLTFDDATGRQTDIDLRGAPPPEPPRRGRPKLGVVAREVTLLPRHWEWLEAQPGGASVTLRKLVEEASRTHAARNARRDAHERASRAMTALAGDLPGYEEASRALFADDAAAFARQVAAWPADVRDYITQLAFGGPA